MAKKSVGDLTEADLKGKVVFERADLNVPLDKATLEITDDTRIRAAVPTLQYLTSKGAKVMLTSHLVRARCRGGRCSSAAPYRELRRARRARAARHAAAEARSRKQAACPPCAALRLCAVLRAAAGAAPPP